MEVKLTKKPKNPIVIEGFPGFGLVGTITTEFLIDHLKAKLIGTIEMDEIPAMVAIHEKKIVQPIGIFYDQKTNIVIVHVITSVVGVEWQMSALLTKMAKDLGAKEVISIEGVGSTSLEEEPKCFYYANTDKSIKIFEKNNIPPLKEGIIMGVTGALLTKTLNMPLACVFAETHSSLPDSKASAKVIEVLDKYLNLKLDPKPLLQQAEAFESKIKGILEQGQEAQKEQLNKRLNYVG